MGLKTKSANVKYVRLKDGKFYLSSDKDFKEPFDELEGKVVDLFFRDEEYQGNKTTKLYIAVGDGNDKYLLGMNFESSYTTKFISFLKNADLNQNLSISIGTEDASFNGKEWVKTTLFITQNGKSVSGAYTKTNPNGMPQMKQVKLGNKMLWDKEAYLKFFENVVNKELKPALNNTVDVGSSKENDASDTPPWEEDGGDLPFE